MDEKELKALQDKLDGREKRLKQAEKGLLFKYKKMEDKYAPLKDKADLVKVLDDAGIKDIKGLESVISVPATKTEKGEDEKMNTVEMKTFIKNELKTMLKEALQPVNSSIQESAFAGNINRGQKALAVALKGDVGKENAFVNNYFKKNPEELATAFAKKLEAEPDISPEDFIKETNESISLIVQNSGAKLQDIVAKEEKGAKDSDASLTIKGEVKTGEDKAKDESQMDEDELRQKAITDAIEQEKTENPNFKED